MVITPLMSNLLLFGFFRVTNACDVQEPRKVDSQDLTSHYHYYMTSLTSDPDQDGIHAEI